MIRTATLSFFCLLFFGFSHLSAQDFRVQIASYEKPMPDTFFHEKGVQNFIVSHDMMGMYRYFVGSYRTRDDAEMVRQEMVESGFPFTTVIDLEEQRVLAETDCPYERPGYFRKQEPKQGAALHTVFFDFGRSTLSEESKVELNAVCQKMKDNANLTLNLHGHTDAIGDAKANVQLATERARAARDYLINKGILANRMYIKVFGESAPQAANAEEDNDGQKGADLPENRKWNRRVELMLKEESGTAKTGDPMGGK
jgi:outer membrane protein OmpA-like peptidoglycan-associated protein